MMLCDYSFIAFKRKKRKRNKTRKAEEGSQGIRLINEEEELRGSLTLKTKKMDKVALDTLMFSRIIKLILEPGLIWALCPQSPASSFSAPTKGVCLSK